MDKNFKFPTETIELPSKGLLYPKESPLSSGKIEMKYMSAASEDILTNINFIKQGTVIDKLLQSLIVEKIDYGSLLSGDKNAILIAARVLGYGKDYTFTVSNPYNSEESVKITIDLTSIEPKPLNEALLKSNGVNEFFFDLPNSDNTISFKLLSSADENKIESEVKGIKKMNPNASPMVTTRLKHMILSINGERDIKTIREFIDNALLAQDSRAIREYAASISPDINLIYSYDFGRGLEEGSVPITADFFWPQSGI